MVQVVLVLCGYICSGKTSFALSLCEHIPEFKRANQDELGDRRAVERFTRQRLDEGYSVVIDRMNFDVAQRKTWLRIAREQDVECHCLFLNVPKEVCATRLATRSNHPTITSVELGLHVLNEIEKSFVAPLASEGFVTIHTISEQATRPTYSEDDIRSLMQTMKAAPVAPPRPKQQELTQFFRRQERNDAHSNTNWRRGDGDSGTTTQVNSGSDRSV